MLTGHAGVAAAWKNHTFSIREPWVDRIRYSRTLGSEAAAWKIA